MLALGALLTSSLGSAQQWEDEHGRNEDRTPFWLAGYQPAQDYCHAVWPEQHEGPLSTITDTVYNVKTNTVTDEHSTAIVTYV